MPKYASTEIHAVNCAACHLQLDTLIDPGGKYFRTGIRPFTVRQLLTSIALLREKGCLYQGGGPVVSI